MRVPLAAEIRVYRDTHDCGLQEARKALLKQAVTAELESIQRSEGAVDLVHRLTAVVVVLAEEVLR